MKREIDIELVGHLTASVTLLKLLTTLKHRLMNLHQVP